MFPLTAMLIAVGCSQAVAPTEENLGIPPGAVEGEYGYNINGRIYDSHAPLGGDGTASLGPLTGQGSAAVQISLYLFYDFGNGLYGNVGLNIPIIKAQPQTVSIYGTSSTKDPQATAYCDCDSNGFIWYTALPGGTVNITKFDTVNDLVSGTFEFTATETSSNLDSDKKVTVTSGYFNDITIGQGGYSQGSVTAEVNGNAFTTDKAGYEMAYADSEFSGLNLFGNGQGSFLNRTITIQNIPIVIGTYIFNDTTDKSRSLVLLYWDFTKTGYDGAASSQNPGSSGQLTISSCDIVHRRISGTFQFSGMDSLGDVVNITNGVINNVQWEP